MPIWCFNDETLRAALAAYATKLAEDKYSERLIEVICKAAVGFLCSQEATKLRVRGEAVEAAPAPMEVEEINFEEVAL